MAVRVVFVRSKSPAGLAPRIAKSHIRPGGPRRAANPSLPPPGTGGPTRPCVAAAPVVGPRVLPNPAAPTGCGPRDRLRHGRARFRGSSDCGRPTRLRHLRLLRGDDHGSPFPFTAAISREGGALDDPPCGRGHPPRPAPTRAVRWGRAEEARRNPECP